MKEAMLSFEEQHNLGVTTYFQIAVKYYT